MMVLYGVDLFRVIVNMLRELHAQLKQVDAELLHSAASFNFLRFPLGAGSILGV